MHFTFPVGLYLLEMFWWNVVTSKKSNDCNVKRMLNRSVCVWYSYKVIFVRLYPKVLCIDVSKSTRIWVVYFLFLIIQWRGMKHLFPPVPFFVSKGRCQAWFNLTYSSINCLYSSNKNLSLCFVLVNRNVFPLRRTIHLI